MKEIKTFEDKTIIIVGSTGLLGKSLVEHFLKLEANVVGVDFKKGPLKNKRKVPRKFFLSYLWGYNGFKINKNYNK